LVQSSETDSSGIANRPSAVTVVIPSWNGRDLLASISLPALAAQSYRDFSIVVVDNGSNDGSASYLESNWPAVTVEALPKNVGFAAAVNHAIAASTSEFIALLNNDVELDSRWLEEMVSAARRLPEGGSYACRLMNFDDRTLITTVGDCVSRGGNIFWRGWQERDAGQYDNVEPVFSTCAGAALYRRQAFETVGPFDEEFFAYLEDVDWGFRAQLAGLPCWYVPSAVAFHVGGATSSRVPGVRDALRARNGYWLVLKNFPFKVAARYAVPLVFVVTRRFYRAFRDGHRRLAIVAMLQALRATPAILGKRHQIQSKRQIRDKELVKLLSRDASLGSRKLERIQSIFGRSRLSQTHPRG
jgi:GT2 family glycosyltransferase